MGYLPGENGIQMSLLDTIVGANFRTESAGRVVVFPGDRRHRGFLVKSPSDELKIKSFLKMFFCAHMSILLLGCLLASGWSHDLNYALGRPALHLYRAIGIALAIYLVVVGVPYFFVWSSYKKALLNFVSPEDEVLVPRSRAGGQPAFILIAAGVVMLALAFLLFFAVSHRP